MDVRKALTQAEFADLVGISQPAVSDLVARQILTPSGTGTAWLIEYCGHLREVAAGRYAGGSVDLGKERALLAREQRERIAMQNAVSRGELAPRELLVQVLAGVAPSVCGQLESIVPALKRRGAYGTEDLAFVSLVIAEARNAISALRLPDVVAHDSADPNVDVEDID